MSRKKKLMFTSISSLVNQIITIISGLILPKLYLSFYGSEVNGLVSSITAFLGFISFAELGVGAVVQSTLYKPLAEKDNDQVSRIVISSERFFHKVGVALVLYICVLIVVYPRIVNNTFDFWFTASLILVISISLFAQYFISMTYKLLLNADQMGYIQTSLHIMALVISTASCVVLVKTGATIQTVRLISSLIFLIQPIGLLLYVKKNYRLNKKLVLTQEPIKQKWNGLTQHISAVVLDKTDVVVLTMFSTLISVSIYHIYYMVVSGVQNIMTSLTSGFQAMLGNMYAKNEKRTLNNEYSFFEWGVHSFTVFLYSCVYILIIPFVLVYTKGIADANYDIPIFAMLITSAFAFMCIRIPYQTMTKAAGHYKQTQNSALIEVAINIVLSVVLVFNYDLLGVAIGTLAAMIYRTIYFAVYLSKHILNRPMHFFIKHLAVDILAISIALLCCSFLNLQKLTFFAWVKMAALVVAIVLVVDIAINMLFYREEVMRCISFIKEQVVGKKVSNLMR